MKKALLILGIIVVAYSIYSLSGEDTDPQIYLEEIDNHRKERDEFMSTSSESPFAIYGDTTVQLRYFKPDPRYKVTAKVELIEEKIPYTLGTSSGKPFKYLKYANLKFELMGKELSLLVLKDPNVRQGGLFTAFADETSTVETYGAGRYLDLDFKRANRVTLDFNLAYNPYCNYNEGYSCPFPPTENLLPIRIEAGELLYE